MTLPGQAAAPPNQGGPDSKTEATRLLCAGVYFDSEYRRRVIEELVEHEERPIAPSLGIDAVPVLVHALRARRREVQTAVALLAVWGVFIGLGVVGVASQPTTLIPIPWFVGWGLLCFLSWSGRNAAGLSVAVFTLDRAMVKAATSGRLKVVLPMLPRAMAVVYWVALIVALSTGRDSWAGLVFPLLLAVPVWVYRAHVSEVMCKELGRAPWARLPRETLANSFRYGRVSASIDREQYAPLTIYDPFRPFIGAGKPYEPWSLAMELRRRDRPAAEPRLGAAPEPGSAPAPGSALTGREVIDLIKPQMEALRVAAAATSRDRLRELEVDEFVYLPVGLPRGEVAYDSGHIRQHLDDAVGEGGEARRHFLRIRVGAWDEQIVVSILVRVHTQGGMLVLEVVPHVLTPVRPEFKAVDVIESRGEDDLLRDALRGLLASPAANMVAGVTLVSSAVAVFRTWLADPRRALPDGPATSVRELGSVTDVSLFQEMDVSRYVKTVQDRIASGVREALRARGYETGEFEQQIVNVSGGGVFIGAMSGGAVATGERASAKHVEGAA